MTSAFDLERVTGIEPAWPAWKAAVRFNRSAADLRVLDVGHLFAHLRGVLVGLRFAAVPLP